MRAFAEAYPNEQIVQQAAGQFPWFHNITFVKFISFGKPLWCELAIAALSMLAPVESEPTNFGKPDLHEAAKEEQEQEL